MARTFIRALGINPGFILILDGWEDWQKCEARFTLARCSLAREQSVCVFSGLFFEAKRRSMENIEWGRGCVDCPMSAVIPGWSGNRTWRESGTGAGVRIYARWEQWAQSMLHGTPSTSIKRSPSTRHYPIAPIAFCRPLVFATAATEGSGKGEREGERAGKTGRREETEGKGIRNGKYKGLSWSGGGRKGAARGNVKRREMRCMPNVTNSCRVVTRVLRGEEERGRGRDRCAT